jgi:uncharacterized protein DUF4266
MKLDMRLALALSLAALALSGAACTHVRFNQKERLADRTMMFDYDSTGAELRAHVLTPREGAVGGFTGSVGAGGCGCD